MCQIEQNKTDVQTPVQTGCATLRTVSMMFNLAIENGDLSRDDRKQGMQEVAATRKQVKEAGISL